jgi:hypothetical protein
MVTTVDSLSIRLNLCLQAAALQGHDVENKE